MWRRRIPRGVAVNPASVKTVATAVPRTFSPSTRSICTRSTRAGAHRLGQRGRSGGEVVLGEREDGLAAAFDEQGQPPVDEDHQRTRLAARPVSLGLGPGERRPVGVRGIAGCHDDTPSVAGVGPVVAVVGDVAGVLAKRVDGRHGGELRPAETVDEVAATDLAGVLESRQAAIDPREAAEDLLGHHRALGHHAVPLQQLLAQTVCLDGRIGDPGVEGEPASGDRRGCGPGDGGVGHQRTRGQAVGAQTRWSGALAVCRGAARSGRSAGEQGPDRCEGVVADATRPHQVPQGAFEVLVGGRGG